MKKVNRSTGQSLLEFALIVPIVIFAIIVFIDLGRVVYSYSALSNAVREGTRFAVVHPLDTVSDQNTLIQLVKDTAPGLNPININVVLTLPTSPDFIITIHSSYSISPITPGLALILGTGNNIVINTESSMQVAPLYQ